MEPSDLQITTTELIGPRLGRFQHGALGVALAGLLLTALGLLVGGGAHFFPSYLVGFMFWLGVTNGCLGWLLIHHITGGGWGFILRRPFEAAAAQAPLMLLFFLPLVLGLPSLYAWAHPSAELAGVLRDKLAYLNTPWFLIRAVCYFAAWSLLALTLTRWGSRQNSIPDPRLAARLSYLGAAGLMLHLLITTFAAVDWLMSLTPTWASSVFGLLVFSAQGLTALAVMLVLLGVLVGDRPLLQEVPSGYFRDLGNLLLTALIFWAYLEFSQYLLIYVGDLVDEIGWYVDRSRHGWEWLSLFLIFGHFLFAALVLILGSRIKRSPIRLARIAAYLAAVRVVAVFWWVMPTFREHLYVTLADLGVPLLIGGIWLWSFARALRDQPVVPFYDPRLVRARQEASEHA